MKWSRIFFGIIFVFMIIMMGRFLFNPEIEEIDEAAYPNEWFYNQRAFPQGEINYDVYYKAVREARSIRKSSDASTNVQWEFSGPDNVGGRITDVEVNPSDPDTIYAAAASGGIFLSADGGENWEPIFDDALSLSVGDIVLDPSNSRILYAGTGEVNGGGGSVTYGGMGLYKSTDAGETWNHIGLEKTRYIARIVIDPLNSDKLFVASMGKLFATNPERGLYRSQDGGETWENVLFATDSTGCIDVAFHPDSPDTVYAAMWERIRRPNNRSYGGVTSGLFRSTDGGDTWSELTNGLPHASPDVGRIGLSISASHPSILYAIYADNIGWFDGVYRTTDGGDSWSRTNDTALDYLFSSYGWWFGNIRVDPADPSIAYVMGLDLYKTTNSGQSWFYTSGIMHVDQHGLIIHPQNSNYVIAGNDGGVYTSWDGGLNWNKSPNLPITQFYTCEIDYQVPQRLYGGTQDNGTIRTLTGMRSDWHRIYGGDGFYVRVDPGDNQYVYAEYQWGHLFRSTNGGSTFYPAMTGISASDRSNWNSPLALDPSDPATLYFGTDRVYRTTNRAQSWTSISPDLSNGPWPGNLTFGTVTTIAVSPANGNVIYAGTDDGNVWITTDGGLVWTRISDAFPERWITRVAADPWESHAAYVTLSGYRWDEYQPHIFKTTNYGESWVDVSGNLPEVPVNDIIVDPDVESVLYSATDVGVFYSADGGALWQLLGDGIPNVPVVDLTLHNPTRTLVAATYGRSMYSMDLDQLTSVPTDKQDIPDSIVLFQNYPNPFNSRTIIEYQLVEPAFVKLSIYNVIGRRVTVLIHEYQKKGIHQVNWDGRNSDGKKVATGTYIYRIQVKGQVISKMMKFIQ